MAESPRLLGQTIRSGSFKSGARLDARYFANDGVAAYAKIAALESFGVDLRPIHSLGRVWDPPRFARSWASNREDSLPYLRPYDVFEYLPLALQYLSLARNDGVDNLRIRTGQLLQTCSGRNLGPLAYADDHLAQFALSHDMIRIEIDETRERFFALAFLQSELGQSLLRRDSSGSVVNHLTVADIERIPIPMLDESVRANVAESMRSAIQLREVARKQLSETLAEVQTTSQEPSEATGRRSWSTQATSLRGRLDAAFYAPTVETARNALSENDGIPLSEIATATLLGRYKRYYVNKGYGRPIVSGRQILQTRPVNLRYVSDRSFRDPSAYVIHNGTVIFAADGRSEGRQGWPALVTSERDGWLASNHVMRVHAREQVRPGAVWLAIADDRVQTQIKALAFGSVVDQTNPADVERVIVPQVSDDLGAKVEGAWAALERANSLEELAIRGLSGTIEEIHRSGMDNPKF